MNILELIAVTYLLCGLSVALVVWHFCEDQFVDDGLYFTQGFGVLRGLLIMALVLALYVVLWTIPWFAAVRHYVRKRRGS